MRAQAEAVRQAGLTKASELWEKLESLSNPVDPINIYKAACTIKCAEFVSRIRDNQILFSLAEFIDTFLHESIAIVGEDKGNIGEGLLVIEIFEREMPLTKEIFDDPVSYATRQHVYDGLIMLSAAKMGKENEVKECIERLQKSVARAMMLAVIQAALTEKTKE